MVLKGIGKFLRWNLTLRYVAALSGVAMLAIGGQVLVQVTLQRQENDARIISTAVNQRFTSQRLGRTAVAIQLASRDLDRIRLIEELRSSSAQLEETHQALRKDQGSPMVEHLFEFIEPDFRSLMDKSRLLLK